MCHVIEQKANECTGDVEVQLVGGGSTCQNFSSSRDICWSFARTDRSDEGKWARRPPQWFGSSWF